MSLHQRIKDIKVKIAERLNAANAASALSETVNDVIIGERAKAHRVQPPILWVYLEPAVIDDMSMALSEDWNLRIIIVSIIKEHDPVTGKERAEQLAITAASALMKSGGTGNIDRTLDSTISTMNRRRFEPGYERVLNQDVTLFGSSFEIELIFCNKEID